MDIHKEFLAFSEELLKSDALDDVGPDLHQLLDCLAEGDDVFDLMANVPEDKVGEVLAWVMNVDLPKIDE